MHNEEHKRNQTTTNIKKSMKEKAEKINAMKYPKSRKNNAEAIIKELKKDTIICGAVDRKISKICTNPPYYKEDGTTNGRCKNHGGASTGQQTEEGRKKALANLNPKAHLIHGMYARFTMTVEEEAFYMHMMNHYIEEYDLDPINIMMLDRGIRNFILNQRKEVAEAGEMLDESQSYNDYDTKFLRYMQSLGMDRKFNVSREHKDNQVQGDIALLLATEEDD